MAFSIAAGFLLAISIIAIGARRLTEEYTTVRDTTDVLIELDAVLSAVTAAETGQRGFLLTGDTKYLAPYSNAAAVAAAHLEALRVRSVSDARRRQHLGDLEPLVEAKLNEVRATLELRRSQGADAALRRVITGEGLRLMEVIRSEVAAMKTEERRQLTELSARYADQLRRVVLSLVVLAGASILVLVGLVAETRRRASELRSTRDTLQTEVAQHAETTALLAALVQSSDDAIIGQDLDGRIVSWNAAAARMYGLSEEMVRGRSLDSLTSGGGETELIAAAARVRQGQPVERLASQQVTRDGRRIYVMSTVSPILDVTQAVIGTSIVNRDMTVQRKAEEARRGSEALSRAFLESAAEGIVATDATGAIVLVNAKTESLFGYARSELVGQPVELLIPARLRERHVGHRDNYMAGPRVRSMGQGLDLMGRRKDGSEFPVEVSLSFVQSEAGFSVIAFVIDISERLALQRVARQADKLAALGTLAAGIAHEINNPIGIISSRVEIILLDAEGVELPAELRKDLDVISRHARRVASITQGLLSFARQSSGTRQPVNMAHIVEEILQLVKKDLSRANVRVTTKFQEPLPEIVADANAIGQVLLNLITNSQRAMPQGGEITIECSRLHETESVRLLVQDTGVGIPADILPRIFDPFFTTRPEGTGLGLAISHGIVHEHHGVIEVRSEEGKGTTFTLVLPIDSTTFPTGG